MPPARFLDHTAGLFEVGAGTHAETQEPIVGWHAPAVPHNPDAPSWRGIDWSATALVDLLAATTVPIRADTEELLKRKLVALNHKVGQLQTAVDDDEVPVDLIDDIRAGLAALPESQSVKNAKLLFNAVATFNDDDFWQQGSPADREAMLVCGVDCLERAIGSGDLLTTKHLLAQIQDRVDEWRTRWWATYRPFSRSDSGKAMMLKFYQQQYRHKRQTRQIADLEDWDVFKVMDYLAGDQWGWDSQVDMGVSGRFAIFRAGIRFLTIAIDDRRRSAALRLQSSLTRRMVQLVDDEPDIYNVKEKISKI